VDARARAASNRDRRELIEWTPMSERLGKVLVSGSSGPIGGALLPLLASRGYQVIRLVRSGVTNDRQILWDPARPVPPGAVSGFDAVIHLAGESIVGRWTAAKKRRIIESRRQGTGHLAQAVAQAPERPRVFISASAIGFYGDRADERLDEDSPAGRGFAADICREWEGAVQSAAAPGVRTVQIRIGVVLSSRGGALPKMAPAFRLGAGGRMGSGRQWWSWIDVQDVAGAVLHILGDNSLRGPVNLVAPNPVTNREFTNTLASVLGRPAIFPMPALAVRLVFGEMGLELFLASQRVEPARLLASGYKFERPQLREALEENLRR
jgi:uncharacterized protein